MTSLQNIRKLRKELAGKVVIPAHHYQRKEITRVADIIGDSYRLAVDVSSSDADFILFCGVHFMAEGAAVLAKPYQKVLMPEPAAGCPMADMITLEQAETALDMISSKSSRKVIPVVYMNAHAGLKAFCGRKGGAVCTSSNAEKILEHYFSEGSAVFFFPDQHLGRNTALRMGIPEGKMFLVNGTLLENDVPGDAEIYLWDGYCPVHQEFTPGQAARLRKKYPGIQVIVHPEVDAVTARAADMTGSTEFIYRIIKESPPGSSWAVGTEQHFVSRLALECVGQDKTIIPLKKSICADMSLTTPELLLETMEQIRDGNYGDKVVTVSDDVREDAKKALSRMISIAEGRVDDG